jgi:hypothetical protein
MSIFYPLGLLCLSLFLFQNCGSGFKANNNLDIYPYSSQPDFFSDIKLVSTEIDETGRQRFEFDTVVSMASNPEQTVNYQLIFQTMDSNSGNLFPACPEVTSSATADTKHQRHVCIIPLPEALFVEMTLLGPNGEESLSQFRF